MKIPKKTYSDFFHGQRALSKLEESITIDYDSKWKYIEDLSRLFNDFQEFYFDYLLKAIWLRNKFLYKGTKLKRGKNGYVKDLAIKVFMNQCVGFDESTLYSSSKDEMLISYIDELFPDLSKRNPFKEKIKYPFKYMKFEHLLLVGEIPERIELLLQGEKYKKTFSDFVNYIVNYILSYNEENGDTYTLYKRFWRRGYLHVGRIKLI